MDPPKDGLNQEMQKPKYIEMHAVLTGINVCDEEKDEQQLQYIEKTTFLHFQKFKERRKRLWLCC